MARPTEPGWYWLRDGNGEWAIVKVDADLNTVWFHAWEGPSSTTAYSNDQWGGRITQEPVADPPPPF